MRVGELGKKMLYFALTLLPSKYLGGVVRLDNEVQKILIPALTLSKSIYNQ